MSRARRYFLLAIALVASLTVAAVTLLYTPYRHFTGELYLTFERGAGSRAMARELAGAGVIRWSWQFVLMRALYPSATLQAGEYLFVQPASVKEVFARIARGDVWFFEFTVPEGSNMFDIAAALDASGVLSGAEFLKAASDPTPIRDLAPAAPTQEGYLFPATYRLTHSITGPALCQMMTAQFRKEWKRIAATENGTPQPAQQPVVTLASLVEKETALAAERPVIAGVFTNRLRQNMRLDCDPTTIYAALLDGRYSGVIHRSDLDSKNPYNTYQNDGLPPGPIANPGREALAAALHPAQTNFLYFVRKPDGSGHQFSATLSAHEKAVRDYRHAIPANATTAPGPRTPGPKAPGPKAPGKEG